MNNVGTSQPVVMNATSPGHPLFPGVVARYTEGSAGDLTVHNVGEGTAKIEPHWNPFAEPIYNTTWADNIDSIIDGFSGQSSNEASGGFVLYPSKPNTNMMQSVYFK